MNSIQHHVLVITRDNNFVQQINAIEATQIAYTYQMELTDASPASPDVILIDGDPVQLEKARQRYPEHPVIFRIPANAPTSMISTCLEKGASYYILQDKAGYYTQALPEIFTHSITTWRLMRTSAVNAADLHTRLSMETLIADIARLLARTTPDTLESSIEHLLSLIGEQLTLDRCFINRFDESRNYIAAVYEWCAEGIPTYKDTIRGLSMKDFSWLMEKLHNQQPIVMNSIDELPAEAAPEKAFWHTIGVKSFAHMPLTIEGELLGIIGFTYETRQINWEPEDIRLLTVVAELFINAIHRHVITRQLMYSRQQYSHVVDNLNVGMVYVERDLTVSLFNRQFSLYLERWNMGPVTEGASVIDILPMNAEAIRRDYKQIFSTGQTIAYTVNILQDYRVRIQYIPMLQDGIVTGVTTLLENITDPHKTRLALQVSEDRFSAIFAENPIPTAVIVIDSGKFVEVNDAFITLTGYQRHEILGKNPIELTLWEENPERRQWQEVLKRRGSINGIEITLRTHDGESRYITLSVIKLEFWDEPCALLLINDRTPLIEQNTRIDNLETAISETWHDIKTPLAVIKLNLFFLRSNSDNTEHYLQVLERQTITLEKMINDMASISRLDANAPLELKPVRINDLIRSTTEEYKVLADARKHTLHFERQAEIDLVNADADYLNRALTNLLVNAINYTPPGGQVTLETHNQHDKLLVIIKDNGIGIKADELRQIFERFYRADAAVSTSIKGTGLGLAIVKKVIERHDGEIEVESEEGTGSTFTIYLPLFQEVDPDDMAG